MLKVDCNIITRDLSAFLFFLVLLLIFVYEITLSAIDVDNTGCLEPFLPLLNSEVLGTEM